MFGSPWSAGRIEEEWAGMQARDVKKLVEDAIADDWVVTNHHHVDLRRALVQPRKITVIERTVSKGKLRDRTLEVWLVLVERPDPEEGYRIVMKENEPVFGLASEGFPEDAHLILSGWYGDFHDDLPGHVAFWRAAANQRLKLSGAAILVFRASTFLQAAPAAAEWGRSANAEHVDERRTAQVVGSQRR
jgi:hypothetical protein